VSQATFPCGTADQANPATAFVIDAAAQALGASWTDLFNGFSGLRLPIETFSALQSEYVQEASALWNKNLTALGEESRAPLTDRRFASTEWHQERHANFNAQLYLLGTRTLLKMAQSLEGDEKICSRLRFAVQQAAAAASPANCFAFNPEALRRAVQTQGQSLSQGIEHFLHDVRKGYVSQTDEGSFEVGQNLACTPGSVVFENDLFQLLQYTPSTAKVFERPLLIVPPCINKYYILDLQANNSLVRYALSEGHQVFMLSWRNPDETMAAVTWDAYIEQGVMQALSVVKAISHQVQINALGFCVGGTLLSTAVAVLSERGEQPVRSLTLLTTLLDFTHTGLLDVFIDESLVQLRELTIGPNSAQQGGLLKAHELASTFSSLRPNELVWNYVVGKYLKGETPPSFDLLYWNADGTHLPGPMACWYLRNTYLENKLIEPAALSVCGTPLHLSAIAVPTYVYASREDHIVPWEGAYLSLQALTGCLDQATFVLGASGHIAGVINPPAQKKRSHWVAPQSSNPIELPPDAAQWLAQAHEQSGSWWPHWQAWLAGHAGRKKSPPKQLGSTQYPVLEPAPGRYVFKRTSDQPDIKDDLR
jgi:polyhydroxyalkanoate synthase subunit PhaC